MSTTREALVQEARELLAKITPGPWQNGVRGSGASGDAHMCRIVTQPADNGYGVKVALQIGVTWHPEVSVSYVGLSRQQCVENAEFIAASPRLVQQLATALEAEQTERRRLEARAQVMLDMHDALSVRFGDDPYTRIAALLKAEAELAALREQAQLYIDQREMTLAAKRDADKEIAAFRTREQQLREAIEKEKRFGFTIKLYPAEPTYWHGPGETVLVLRAAAIDAALAPAADTPTPEPED